MGNLDDITLRALKVLASVDVIAAEDTRTTAHLLDHHGLRTPMMAAHRHNERRAAAAIVERLARGETVALVSDAGTPAVSDPGAIIVAEVRAAGFRVTPIPGANAAIAALSAAGMTETPFTFVGFLPSKAAARRKAIEALRKISGALVFYEAPHRIVECAQDLAAALGGDRVILIAREITKLFEQIHRCQLDEAAAWLSMDENRQRGEFVLVVEGAAGAVDDAEENLDRVLRPLLDELTLVQAVKLACAIAGSKKNSTYARALELSGEIEKK